MIHLKLGVVINPVAGLGGPAGLKGSDHPATVETARSLGIESRVRQRVLEVFGELGRKGVRGQITVYSSCSTMGVCSEALPTLTWQEGFTPVVDRETTGEDTIAAARKLLDRAVDLILFAGGDGTARNIYEAVGQGVPVLGIPSGVKMHSGVFATSPSAVAGIVKAMLDGKPVSLETAEVRDIDESALAKGVVNSRYFGELLVPQYGNLVQQVKCGSPDDEALVVAEIAAHIDETQEADVLYLVGAGRTTKALKDLWGQEGSLLGVDAYRNGSQVGCDLNAPDLLALARSGPTRLVVSVTGGQGFLFGRGNQQLSSEVLRAVGVDNICIVSSRGKLRLLDGRPLLVDTGDAMLDREISGYRKIVAGYEDVLLYPVSRGHDPEAQ